jgi:hypothetical protein
MHLGAEQIAHSGDDQAVHHQGGCEGCELRQYCGIHNCILGRRLSAVHCWGQCRSTERTARLDGVRRLDRCRLSVVSQGRTLIRIPAHRAVSSEILRSGLDALYVDPSGSRANQISPRLVIHWFRTEKISALMHRRLHCFEHGLCRGSATSKFHVKQKSYGSNTEQGRRRRRAVAA